jgi:hypothetical protein
MKLAFCAVADVVIRARRWVFQAWKNTAVWDMTFGMGMLV